MHALHDFVDRHPLLAGLTAAGSGALAKLADCLHIAAGVAADIGIIAGSAAAILGCALAAHRFRHRNDKPNFSDRIDPNDDLDY